EEVEREVSNLERQDDRVGQVERALDVLAILGGQHDGQVRDAKALEVVEPGQLDSLVEVRRGGQRAEVDGRVGAHRQLDLVLGEDAVEPADELRLVGDGDGLVGDDGGGVAADALVGQREGDERRVGLRVAVVQVEGQLVDVDGQGRVERRV